MAESVRGGSARRERGRKGARERERKRERKRERWREGMREGGGGGRERCGSFTMNTCTHQKK